MARRTQKTKVVKKGGLLGKLLCLLLGIVIGAGGVIGGVVGAGYYVYTHPLNQTVSLIDKYVPADVYAMLFGTEDKGGFLNEKYASLKVSELLGDGLDAVKGLSQNGSLSALNEISPKVGDLVSKLLAKTEKYAIPLDKDTLMSKSIKDIPKYLGDSVKATALGDLLDALGKGNEPLLMSISYGAEGVDYTLDENGKVVMLGNAQKTTVNDLLAEGGMTKIIDKLTLDSVMTVDANDTVMCAIAYGSSNRYTVADGKVTMTQVTYTLEDKGSGAKLYDDKDVAVAATANTVSANLMTLTFANGETQYVSLNADGVGKAFSDAALTSPVLYKKTRIGDLTEDSMSVINNIYLKDALGVDADGHKVLISLAYGEENVDFRYVGEGESKAIEMIGSAKPRTIGELRNRGGNLINDIPLSDIMTADKDEPIVMYLLFGRENIHYTIDGNGAVTMLQKQIALIGKVAYNEYGEKLSGYTVDTANKLYTDTDGNEYKYTSSGLTTETADGTAAVYYLTDLEGNAVRFPKTKLGDLTGSNNVITSLTKRITIKEVIDEETMSTNKFFKHVKDETIESLPGAIDNLTLQQVYATEIYKTNADGEFIDKNGNVTTNKNEYVIEHEWWYLLHDEQLCSAEHGADRDKQCIQDYKITELNVLIDNMRKNIEAATLYQLKEDKMLDALDDNTLNSSVKTKIGGQSIDMTGLPTDKNTLGEFTVVEMLNYVNAIFKAVDLLEKGGL